jgi:peptidoglycan/xylan/chitin deacetylase (PgdA/CDA1 family)
MSKKQRVKARRYKAKRKEASPQAAELVPTTAENPGPSLPIFAESSSPTPEEDPQVPDEQDDLPEVHASDFPSLTVQSVEPADEAAPLTPPEERLHLSATVAGTPSDAGAEATAEPSAPASLPAAPPVAILPASPAAAVPPPPERVREPIIIRQAAAPEGSWRWPLLLALNAAIVAMLGVLLLQNRGTNPATGLAHFNTAPRHNLAAAPLLPPPSLEEAPVETTAEAIVVRGSSPGAVTATVLLNGEAIGAVLGPDGAFTTPEVPLAVGLNVIQVRTNAANDPFPRYSLAHLVRRREAPAPREQSLRLVIPPQQDISRGNPARQAVSFTFDGGSEANAAAEILDVLRDHGVVTTLFLTGEFIRKYPEIVKQAFADGHEIGNHTFTHPHLTTFNKNSRHDLLPNVSEAFFKSQLTDTENAYRAVTGKPMAPFWRAPYGEVNAQLQLWAGELGYRHVGWTRRVGSVSTLDSLDWVNDQDSHLYLSGTQLKKRFVTLVMQETQAVQGGIFLMHLGTQRRTDKIHWQLADILTAYKDAGFEILPVSQIIR